MVLVAISNRGISKSLLGSQFGHLYQRSLASSVSITQTQIIYSSLIQLVIIILDRQQLEWMKMSNLCPKRLIYQMSSRHVRLRIVGSIWHKRFTKKSKQQEICCIEFKMKEFDKNFVESLLKGVKAKVRSISDNCVYDLFKYFFYLEINSLFREKKTKVVFFFLSLDIQF